MTEAVELTKDYDQPRRMVLDVYTHAKAPKDIGLRPVLVNNLTIWNLFFQQHSQDA